MSNYDILNEEVTNAFSKSINKNFNDFQNDFYKNIYLNFHHGMDLMDLVAEVREEFMKTGEEYNYDYNLFENDYLEKKILDDMNNRSKQRLKDKLIHIDFQLGLHQINAKQASIASKQARDEYEEAVRVEQKDKEKQLDLCC